VSKGRPDSPFHSENSNTACSLLGPLSPRA
jgi:hypothetical protein